MCSRYFPACRNGFHGILSNSQGKSSVEQDMGLQGHLRERVHFEGNAQTFETVSRKGKYKLIQFHLCYST